MTKLATHSQQDFESLMLSSSLATEGVLIELPGVILATFTPILENLQYMQRISLLPFRQWILPDRRGLGDLAAMDIPPPLYARGSRFTYSLSSILNDGTGKDLLIQTSDTKVNDAALDEIERRTELDRGQSEALLAALLREFCHIQGPPGTGKSFLGVKIVKVLLACRAAKLGPIIIVCYTTRLESFTIGDNYAALRKEHKSIEEILRHLDGLDDYPSWNADIHAVHGDEKLRIAKFLADAVHKDLIDDLFESNECTENFHRTIQNVYSDIDRRVLQRADIIGVTTTGLATKISTLRHVNAKVIICEEAGEVLKSHMLSALLPTVEHFISIGDHEQLRPSINNHNLSLESHSGAPYQLDRSQFERLSVGDPGRFSLPVAQLNIQRRMRPGISRFIKKIYPRLIDHDVTKALPNVVGMRENTFWLDHDNLQDNVKGDDINKKSHSNAWEVEMTAALVRHIVRQGAYSSSDIAVLTPYSGQLQKLRLHMRKEFEISLSDRDEEKTLQKKNLSELLRIATVDNVQGEGAKVVIVSLVRSNQENNVGFLKTTNRINKQSHARLKSRNMSPIVDIKLQLHALGMSNRLSSAVPRSVVCSYHVDTRVVQPVGNAIKRKEALWLPSIDCAVNDAAAHSELAVTIARGHAIQEKTAGCAYHAVKFNVGTLDAH
ncbi:hypothetical protein EYC84_006985 [Monilinia fructicola]|uniref:DNA2/NAM7 helicase-like C-terminal domain-containing protein n=1 Tax=Monilinia fructicola TaxID=38448 RepID=A0A5M9K7U8_MONFR|nr:hypothetical protein EYC84_006985 [Monilinia fructicola]